MGSTGVAIPWYGAGRWIFQYSCTVVKEALREGDAWTFALPSLLATYAEMSGEEMLGFTCARGVAAGVNLGSGAVVAKKHLGE